jgi:hypothetical protein
MSSDTPPSSDAKDCPPNLPNPLLHPDLKRTLKDLLVQDDSDVEMLEKRSIEDEKLDGSEDAIDPDMCVECGDQVRPTFGDPWLMRREPLYGVINAKSNFAKCVIITSFIEPGNEKHIHSTYSIQISHFNNPPHK